MDPVLNPGFVLGVLNIAVMLNGLSFTCRCDIFETYIHICRL